MEMVRVPPLCGKLLDPEINFYEASYSSLFKVLWLRKISGPKQPLILKSVLDLQRNQIVQIEGLVMGIHGKISDSVF